MSTFNWADASIEQGLPDLVYRDQGAVTFQNGGFAIAGMHSQFMEVPTLTRSIGLAGCTGHEEISWAALEYRKYNHQGKKRITELCGDFFYKLCFNPGCDRIHTRDREKMRYYFDNPKMKQMHCKANTACKHYMCAFIHTPDVYLMLVNGMPLLTETHEHVRAVMAKWDADRHEEYLKYK